MTVSASAVVSRDLLAAQAAANSTTTAAASAYPVTTKAGPRRNSASCRSTGVPFCLDIACVLAGRGPPLRAHLRPIRPTLPHASHKKTPRWRGVFFPLDLLGAVVSDGTDRPPGAGAVDAPAPR